MALTRVAWTSKTVNGILICSCSVEPTAAENDAYTLKTPTTLNPRKPWTLIYQAASTPDGQALPLEVFIGYDSDFVITGDAGTIGATSGAKFKQAFDDVVLAVPPLAYAILFDPELSEADVVTVSAIATGPKVKIPIAPYYAFNLNGGSTLPDVVNTFKIIQAQ